MNTYNKKDNPFLVKINSELHFNIEDIIILICSIFIASIGLNMNSTPIVIGAMLISPLMTSVIGIGISLAFQDTSILRKSITLLALQVIVSLVVSTLYFSFSPLTYASSEIIARTNPTIWDVVIAFTGGVAGVIGFKKKTANNIVPGVAIATALMPPLCTLGYAISIKNMTYIFGAFYLFVINIFFISLSTFMTVYIFEAKNDKQIDSIKKKSTSAMFIILTIIIIIPSIYTASSMVKDSLNENNLNRFIESELKDSLILEKKISKEKKTIHLTLSDTSINDTKLQSLQNKLPEYHLGNMDLNIKQITETDSLSGKELEHLIRQLIDSETSVRPSIKEEPQALEDFIIEKNKIIKTNFPLDIKKLYMNSEVASNEEQIKNVLTIELKSNLTKSLESDIESYVLDTYNNKIDNLSIVFKEGGN